MSGRGKKQTGWSYMAGEKGVNRVRAFEHGARGLFLEWREQGRRERLSLGDVTHEAAKQKAEELAARIRRNEPPKPDTLTLAELFDKYELEVSPQKGVSKRKHDLRCSEMFRRFLGGRREPHTLSRLEWDRFIAARRKGDIAPGGVKERRTVGRGRSLTT